ncbi:CDP-diacylglycerol--glycerol-3-phosphate 3-phosphatidyltransferase [Thalassotalea sp. HSM 43]|uniref:CDP-diacylglycerol--glycerol-3-phosphate 3-phosphatidyltransferase n=1 Tax=Thalassotalea sp. HSM 43 TaxID=2552945 RepID=UPI00107FE240|nr:CDP-diacylglycerol--glycerol-3-phosphate 3-phosphatidyltransferase [Thalassotalea sp. HSM 43]QBY02862.1 CDP-diacylglycerol--glycerol-3-phosphate 3-phosphatidyltransferase [Thalassotalea sp. HSM 43]
MWTIPNQITLFRIVLIPVFIVVYYFHDMMPDTFSKNWSNFAAFAVFWVASVSDGIDGYLARKLDQSSRFGAFIDPVADKLMVTISLVLIASEYQNIWVTIPAVIMIAREIVISALREFMADLGKRANVAVSDLGKWKTAAQMLALMGLIWQPNYPIPLILFDLPADVIIYAAWMFYFFATVFAFVSMAQYLRAAWPELSGQS